jgi:ADP-glucose pyrophosphorylase
VAAGCEVVGSIVKDSILDEGAVIQNSILGQSIVGRKAKVEERPRSVNVGDSSAIGLA